MLSFQEELILLLKSRYPTIYISTLEEERLEYDIRTIFSNYTERNIYIWDFIDGYQNNPTTRNFGKKNPLQALEFIEKTGSKIPTIFILKDFRRFLTDISVSRKLRNISKKLKLEPKTIIIIDSEVSIPTELKDLITVINYNLPNSVEIRQEIIKLLQKLNKKKRLNNKLIEPLTQSCQGLSMERIRRAFAKILTLNRRIDARGIPIILEEKKQIISQTQILEFCKPKETLDDVAGLIELKKWLDLRSVSFTEKAALYGLPRPRGVLLVGMQGSGKSLVAKAIANDWQLPLLRLDVGRLFGGIIGESESRMREMIRISESMAPCVLWVDELDKAFSSVEGSTDGGTSQRVLGTFITWLAEKELPVFVVGTANDIEDLPLELIRKGRFDEIFFIGLPNREARKLIFQVHIAKLRPKTWPLYNYNLLCRQAFHFSGAEIEQVIYDGMHRGFHKKRDFRTIDISKCIKKMVPLSHINLELTEAVEDWTHNGRIRAA